METISNVASAASKLVFGDQKTTTEHNETAGQEPISGQQGKGTANEPFDQGNADDATKLSDPKTDLTATHSDSNKPTSSLVGNTGAKPTSSMSGIVGDTTTGNSGSTETSGLPKASSTPNNPSNVAAGDSDPLRSTDKTGVISGHQGNAPKTDVVNPTSRSENPGGVPDSGATPQVKHQGIDQPTDKPTGEQQTAIRDSKNEAEELLKKRDPNDHSGEPMKMHDGSESAIPNTQAERRNSKAGMPGGQEHGKDPKGTGEQWVKTSGTAADGGDFDATKPGAGREADRLMEEKGIKRSDKSPAEQPATATAASPSGTKETKEKESLSEKLKHKLHIGHSHRKA